MTSVEHRHAQHTPRAAAIAKSYRPTRPGGPARAQWQCPHQSFPCANLFVTPNTRAGRSVGIGVVACLSRAFSVSCRDHFLAARERQAGPVSRLGGVRSLHLGRKLMAVAMTAAAALAAVALAAAGRASAFVAATPRAPVVASAPSTRPVALFAVDAYRQAKITSKRPPWCVS